MICTLFVAMLLQEPSEFEEKVAALVKKLEAFPDRGSEEEQRAYTPIAVEACDALTRMGPDGFTPLKAFANHEKPHVRLWLVKILRVTGKGESRPILEKALADSEEGVRREAVEQLAELEPGPSRQKIAVALKDASADVRVAAVRALDKDPGATESLRPSLTDQAVEVRRAAALALVQRSETSAIPALVEASLKAAPMGDYVAAIRALEKVTGKNFGRVVYSEKHGPAMNREQTEGNDKVRRAWLEWWEKEGKEKYKP